MQQGTGGTEKWVRETRLITALLTELCVGPEKPGSQHEGSGQQWLPVACRTCVEGTVQQEGGLCEGPKPAVAR